MSAMKVKSTLADKIGDILSSAPNLIDPEDQNVDETSAIKIAEKEQFDSLLDDADVEENETELLNNFRKQTAELLEDGDVKYQGKRVNRKRLRSDDEDQDFSEESDDESEDFADESDDEINEEDGGNDEDEENDEDEVSVVSDEIENGEVKILVSKSNRETMRGLAVKRQLKMWENLLEARIQLQKCLTASNRMPQGDYYDQLKRAKDAREFQAKVDETCTSLKKCLDKLLSLQESLVRRYPETKGLYEDEFKDSISSNDEEIESDFDESAVTNEIAKKRGTKHRKMDYQAAIADFRHRYKRYRDGVIAKWSDKTRSTTKKSGNSILDHMEYSLQDKQRLIRKSQLKRVQYDIVGKGNNQQLDGVDEENYDETIYDDHDFYHQLLRELIEMKSSDLIDPIQLSKQWIRLQSLRSKMKRRIDTRATKGRKIRYVVHPKLVNFMAPIGHRKTDARAWTDEAMDELFGSVFGKRLS